MTTEPTDYPTILLVSPDLLATSRLAAAARDVPARLVTIRSLTLEGDRIRSDIAGAGLILLDLGGFASDPAPVVVALRRLLGQEPTPRIVAFGPHVARERLADAVAAGADQAVSRGELLGGFTALARRWLTQAGD